MDSQAKHASIMCNSRLPALKFTSNQSTVKGQKRNTQTQSTKLDDVSQATGLPQREIFGNPARGSLDKVEKTGPTNWSIDDLNKKYRQEQPRKNDQSDVGKATARAPPTF